MRKRLIIAGLCVLALLLAGNLQYLFWCTYRVKNNSGQPLAVSLEIEHGRDLKPVDLGTLAPGATRRGFLRPGGDASFRVYVLRDGVRKQFCGDYIENEMYHAEVVINAAGERNAMFAWPGWWKSAG